MIAMLVLMLCCVALAKATDNSNNTKPPFDVEALVPTKYHLTNIMIPKEDKSSSRIVGGEEATPNAFPYMAFLVVPVPRDISTCGGSLISKQTVLSAAHCVERAIGNVEVTLGAHDIRNSEPSQQHFSVPKPKYKIHEGYGGARRSYQNDIAILHLPTPAELNKNVQLLPLATDPNQEYELREAVLCGWGLIQDKPKKMSFVLKTVTLSILANHVCNVAFFNKVRNTNLCVSGNGGKSTCNGDSGGPLVLDGIQIGIVSFGTDKGCELGWPVVYSRVTSFLDWINKNTI